MDYYTHKIDGISVFRFSLGGAKSHGFHRKVLGAQIGNKHKDGLSGARRSPTSASACPHQDRTSVKARGESSSAVDAADGIVLNVCR